MTPDQIKEFMKAKSDCVYFVENYCKIEDPIRGVIPFKMYEFQKDIIRNFQNNRFNIVNKSRQVGLSTITASYALWLAVFYRNQKIVILSIKDQDAQVFLKKIKIAFQSLPSWMIDTPITSNAHELQLTTGSIIRSVASGEQAARGQSLSLLIIDEAAFIKKLDEIWKAALPTMSKGGSTIMISTPNGLGNTFYDNWEKSAPTCPKEDRNEFLQTFVHWSQVPDYRGFDITDGMSFNEIVEKAKQGKWYTQMRPQFDDRQWAQEFEGDFLGSGLTVVDPDVLKDSKALIQEPIKKMGPNEGLWIWQEADMSKYYVIGADIASGEGEDYSTAQVLCVSTGEQVAEFQGKMSIRDFADFLVELATMYNDALLIPEYTGLGKGTVQKIVNEIGYHNIYQTVNETTSKVRKHTYGWNTSVSTRPLLIAQIQEHFNSQSFQWYSERLWNELTRFVWKSNNKAEADGKSNDDLVMAFAIAAYNREAALKHAPVDLDYTVYEEEDPIITNATNYVENGKILDPYSLDIIDADESDLNFDADDEKEINKWLLS